MSLPTYEELMLPLLKLLKDGKEHAIRTLASALSEEFRLTPEELAERLPSGGQCVFDNRVGWAKTYMKKAGLLTQPRRGVCVITSAGKTVLETDPAEINDRFLMQFENFRDFQKRPDSKEESLNIPRDIDASDQRTPEEQIDSSYQTIRRALTEELLIKIMESSPAFFERLVVDLLVAMGYGGTLSDAGRAIGRSGDEGIDGIIKEDRLGLDTIYIQAKRWQAVVGRPEIQRFVGALSGQRARKGVFITSSNFSTEAREYASKIESKVILIDGTELAQLMIDHNIGTSDVVSYIIKRVDSDYFVEE